MNDMAIHTFLKDLYETGLYQDAHEQERSRKFLNLEPQTAELLHMFIRSSQRKHLLEIGTSNGYSTIWLAWAVSITEGQVISIEQDMQKQSLADANLRRVGLREFVDLKRGAATEVVKSLPGPFDCVFFDADRYSAPAQLTHLLPRLSQDVLVFADNVLSHPNEIADYLQAVEALSEFDHLVVPIGKGLSVAYRGTTR